MQVIVAIASIDVRLGLWPELASRMSKRSFLGDHRNASVHFKPHLLSA